MDIGAEIKDQYKVVEHIGRGGMADVWSARDQRLRRMVAIKTIAQGMSQDADPVSLFEREAQTIAQMEHPHILPIYDFGEYDNSLYIVMRYVTGGSLEDALVRGPLTVEDTLRIAEAVAKALDYAHDNSVIHLDLKPGNILLDSAGSPYLADFGLATVLDPQGRARNPGSGTLLYMAPEQATSEVVDHRADIYSFCVMLFHMLTGQLPFEGRAPLSIQQIQSNEELPELDEINPNFPIELTDILREGTDVQPEYRPDTHMEIVERLREVLQEAGGAWLPDGDGLLLDVDPDFAEIDADFAQIGSDLLEAVDLYSRARHNWQNGQGRFLLGLTHFMLMSDSYQDSASNGLSADEQGLQVLLRGALEYDYELEYWWERIKDDAARRWVCLHTLRSGTTPARIRAMYRLETLPDDPRDPVIPRLVAQALEVEGDDRAKIAALRVLGTRAYLLKDKPVYKVKTEYAGRLLTSMTRLGIQVSEATQWRETIYSQDVDELVAETAFDESEDVAEFAARTIGKMNSLAAVRYISDAQQAKRNGALEALAYIRDEAPALPDVVSRQARSYAWMTNTVNRMVANPLEGLLRILLALLGGWLAMGEQIYNLFRTEALFSAPRWANTIAVGALFGLMIAIAYTAGHEVNRRMRGFWSWWLRLLVFGTLGFLFSTLAFGAYNWLIFQFTPPWPLMRVAGAGLSFGLVASALLDLKPRWSILLTLFATFLPIFGAHNAANFPQSTTIVPGLLLVMLVGVSCGWVAATRSTVQPNLRLPQTPIAQTAIGGVAGLVWAGATWLYLLNLRTGLQAGELLTWDGVLLLYAIMTLIGVGAGYWLRGLSRVSFSIAALALFSALYVTQSWQFFDQVTTLQPLAGIPAMQVLYAAGTPIQPGADTPVFFYDNLNNIYTVTLPMVLVLALGVNAQPLVMSLAEWVGKPRAKNRERGEWLSVLLPYTLLLTALVALLSLFSLQANAVLALFWSAWGGVTFVLALAAWRWAKWGADGLLISGGVMVAGALLYDVYTIYSSVQAEREAGLLQSFPVTLGSVDAPFLSITLTAPAIWMVWSVVVGIFAWSARRKQLWGGIGLSTMAILWYIVAISTPLQGSMAVFAVTHLALIAFALGTAYEFMDAGRFPLWHGQEALEPDAVAADTIRLEPRTEISANMVPTEAVALPDQADVETEVIPTTGGEIHTAPDIRVSTEALRTKDIATDDDAAAGDEDRISTEPRLNRILDKADADDKAKAADETPGIRIKLDTSNVRTQRTINFAGDPGEDDDDDPGENDDD